MKWNTLFYSNLEECDAENIYYIVYENIFGSLGRGKKNVYT